MKHKLTTNTPTSVQRLALELFIYSNTEMDYRNK